MSVNNNTKLKTNIVLLKRSVMRTLNANHVYGSEEQEHNTKNVWMHVTYLNALYIWLLRGAPSLLIKIFCTNVAMRQLFLTSTTA